MGSEGETRVNRRMTSRKGLVVVLLAFVAALPHLAGAAGRGDKPDIVVVMVDDLGAIDERILSRLPNINEMFLANGLRFDSAYAETPLCCPARASFLTGQHTRKHGVVKNRARLLDPRNTIATTLHDAGYWTMMVGKYLNHTEQVSDKTPDGWDRSAILNTWWGNEWSSWWVQGRPTMAGYKDRKLTWQAMRWLRRAPTNQPVFMYLTPRAPHWGMAKEDRPTSGRASPWKPDVEKRYERDHRCDNIPAWKPGNYDWDRKPDGFPLEDICRSLLTVDDMVGKVRDEMRRQGRSPVWMFTSDNGMAWGVDGYSLKNVPQAGRLPVYFAGQDVVEGSTNALVSNIDFGPTLADLAGTSMSAADGVSFASLLRGAGGGRDWMLEDHPRGGFSGVSFTGGWWGVRTRDWHLVEWHGTHLYNVRSDPLEMRDVSRLYSRDVIRLESLARAAMRAAAAAH
jgi:N-acetylglucosamine-6-sulfatase